jgi:hypothetical protein
LEEPAASFFRVEEYAEHGRNATDIENCLKNTGSAKAPFPRAG